MNHFKKYNQMSKKYNQMSKKQKDKIIDELYFFSEEKEIDRDLFYKAMDAWVSRKQRPTHMNLKLNFEFICQQYIDAFCKKQNIDFDGWVGEDIGGIASFCGSQYFFNLSDIVLDITTKQPKWLILQWANDGCEENINEHSSTINYKSYTMGLRYEKFNPF